jgi:hypothetical protein
MAPPAEAAVRGLTRRHQESIMRRYLPVLALALLGACALPTVAGYEKKLNAWIGADEVDLVRNWGAPDRVHEAAGRKFIGYSAVREVHHSGTPTTIITVIKDGTESTSTTLGTPDRIEERRCYTTFELESGKVVAWSHQGEDCRAPE